MMKKQVEKLKNPTEMTSLEINKELTTRKNSNLSPLHRIKALQTELDKRKLIVTRRHPGNL